MKSLLEPAQVEECLRAAEAGASVYLLGAGGCGMSGLGHLLLDLGYRVVGSDMVVNEEVRQLEKRGARIRKGHAAGHVCPEAFLFAYTSAVRPDNPELIEAARLGIPVVRRGTLLAALMQSQKGICVAGMHGKTTTSALLALALSELGTRPSYAVGAQVGQLRPHARFSGSVRAGGESAGFFVAEADESDGTLRGFTPQHAIVLNVDAEHLDHFAGLEAILAEFREFAAQTQKGLVFCADDPRLAELFTRHPQAISYGFHPLSDYRIELHVAAPPRPAMGGGPVWTAFQVWHGGLLLGEFQIQLLGQQNVSNATAVIALLHQLGFAPGPIGSAVACFQGAARRQQELYRDDQVRVFEDYGHHPNEIRATLRALKSLPHQRLVVAFQPHRFTRTQHLWKEFAGAFREADRLWLAELYPASEPEIPGISSGFLAGAIRAHGQSVEGVVPVGHLAGALRSELRAGDLMVFLGAGDITEAAHELASSLQQESERSSPKATGALPERIQTLNSMKPELCARLVARLAPDSVVRPDEPLAKRTTLRVGGKADLYVEPSSEADLAEVLRFAAEHGLPTVLLGRGSNLLIRDGGIRGVVICLAHEQFSRIEIAEEKLRCGAGARLKRVSVEARRHGLGGLEFLEGIPGSVGGAMRMNAGAMGSWLFDVVETIRFMNRSGAVVERRASEINVEYRGCPLFRDHIALSAVLVGQPAPEEAIQARMEQFSRRRWESQPSQPSAGCIFKNPLSVPAGKLIDELGLKGTRVGGARVSEVHANFIVNDGSATARDVLNLIGLIKERAQATRGIKLETEVEILGEG